MGNNCLPKAGASNMGSDVQSATSEVACRTPFRAHCATLPFSRRSRKWFAASWYHMTKEEMACFRRKRTTKTKASGGGLQGFKTLLSRIKIPSFSGRKPRHPHSRLRSRIIPTLRDIVSLCRGSGMATSAQACKKCGGKRSACVSAT